MLRSIDQFNCAGRGSYFAEDAAKSDQYTVEDERFNREGAPLHDLHTQLYKNVRHPTGVRYMLVCRVLLGRIAFTKDGSYAFTVEIERLAVAASRMPEITTRCRTGENKATSGA
jgi:hypothetical protein